MDLNDRTPASIRPAAMTERGMLNSGLVRQFDAHGGAGAKDILLRIADKLDAAATEKGLIEDGDLDALKDLLG